MSNNSKKYQKTLKKHQKTTKTTKSLKRRSGILTTAGFSSRSGLARRRPVLIKRALLVLTVSGSRAKPA